MINDNLDIALEIMQFKQRIAECKQEEVLREKFHLIYGDQVDLERDVYINERRFDAFKEGYRIARSDAIKLFKQEMINNNLQIIETRKQ